jgi:hypothetical protein
MTVLYLHNLAHKKNHHQNSAALIATSRTPVLHQQLAANAQAMNFGDQLQPVDRGQNKKMSSGHPLATCVI